MNQKHVPSMELCQQFVNLCSKSKITLPETEFYWIVNNETLSSHLVFKSKHGWYIRDDGGEYRTDRYPKGVISIISAPLVSEQGEIFNKVGAKNFIKAYGDVFNFPGTGMVGDLGVINLMRRPNMGMKMLNYLIETGRVTEL